MELKKAGDIPGLSGSLLRSFSLEFSNTQANIYSLNSCPPCPFLLCFTQEICNMTGLQIESGPSLYLPAGLAGFYFSHVLIWKQILEISCKKAMVIWPTIKEGPLSFCKKWIQRYFSHSYSLILPPTHTHIYDDHSHTYTHTHTHTHRYRRSQSQWVTSSCSWPFGQRWSSIYLYECEV